MLNAEYIKRLYFAAVEHIDQAKGQDFNISGGIENSLSLLELLDILEEELDVKLNYTKLPGRKSDQKEFVADRSKANALIQWFPRMNKFSGIRELFCWVNTITTK